MRRCFLLLCLLAWGAAGAQTAPSNDALPAKLRYDRPARSAAEQRAKEEAIFRYYAVPLSDLKSFPHVGPRLDTEATRMFRTRLRQAAATSPVFADTVAVQVVGCGTECSFLAMVDVQSGFSVISEGVWAATAEHATFRRNSRAIHVLGLINETSPGDRWYVWTGRALKLVYFKSLSEECFHDADQGAVQIAQTAACDYLPEDTP